VNKRLIAFLSIFSLSLSLTLVPANAAVKAGAKCSKVGIKSVAGSKTFTCIKSGKKLLWNKGISPKIKPSPVNSSTESQSRQKTISCEQGGPCLVGDVGPGGGIVFYVAKSNFISFGSDCQDECKYMEASTSDIPDKEVPWCPFDAFLGTTMANGIKIGTGMSNTNLAAEKCKSGANKLAQDYVNNNKLDWHLPSKDELNQLFLQRSYFKFKGYLWSSSEADSFWSWYISLNNYPLEWLKFDRGHPVGFARPVRAF
jgi:hypothetical protein